VAPPPSGGGTASRALPKVKPTFWRIFSACRTAARARDGCACLRLTPNRYYGLAKTSLQHLTTAAAINLDRIAAWFGGRPIAPTRTSRFAALAA
jgi:hypothetical protein